MCIVADSARLSKTKIFSYQKSEQTHGFLYSNSAVSEVPDNAMILAIPCKKQEKVKLFDGTPYKPFLDSFDDLFNISRGGFSESTDIRVEQVGAYKTSFVNHAAFEIFCENCDFMIQEAMFNFLMNQYQGWVFTICEWHGKEPISSQPIHIEFDTMYRNDLYFPMMDGHTIAPQKGNIERDHILGFSTLNHLGFHSNNNSPATNKRFDGCKVKEWSKNGDSWINLDENLIEATLDGRLIKTSFEMP